MIRGGTLAEHESQHRAGRGWLRGDQEIQHYRSSEEPRRKYAPRGGRKSSLLTRHSGASLALGGVGEEDPGRAVGGLDHCQGPSSTVC